MSKAFTCARLTTSESINAQALATLVASVTSAQSSTLINVLKLGKVKSSTLPVQAVLLARTLLVAMFSILSRVTASSSICAVSTVPSVAKAQASDIVLITCVPV